MNIDAFRQMVAKNPKGFLGRYGLGNKLLQEGGNLEEAADNLRAPIFEEKVVDFMLELIKLNEREVSPEELTAVPAQA